MIGGLGLTGALIRLRFVASLSAGELPGSDNLISFPLPVSGEFAASFFFSISTDITDMMKMACSS